MGQFKARLFYTQIIVKVIEFVFATYLFFHKNISDKRRFHDKICNLLYLKAYWFFQCKVVDCVLKVIFVGLDGIHKVKIAYDNLTAQF